MPPLAAIPRPLRAPLPPLAFGHFPLTGGIVLPFTREAFQGVRPSKAPSEGADSPCQGEMSRSDRGGRDAVAEGDWGRIQITTPSRPPHPLRPFGPPPPSRGRLFRPPYGKGAPNERFGDYREGEGISGKNSCSLGKE